MQLRKSVLSLLAMLATVGVVRTSDAGYTSPATPYCTLYADHSGFCTGTFAAFRASPNANDFAYASDGSLAGYAMFYASLRGVSYSCTQKNETPQWLSFATASPTTSFYVAWSSTGSCGLVSLTAGSYLQ